MHDCSIVVWFWCCDVLEMPVWYPTQPEAALTFSTHAFTPTLHAPRQYASPNPAHLFRTYLSCASVAKPVSTGTGVPEGSCEVSRGAMTMRQAPGDYCTFQIALWLMMS